MQANDITFFQRFQDDILAGRKTITIRDAAESHFKPGDVLRVGRYEDDGYFCTIAVTATSTVTLDTLTEQHAQQENMTLGQLRQVISDIYPGESQFYVIEFKTLKIIRNSCELK
ncbi:N(4)-acetylcytidine aminohydrolase [Klebsiella pneumoniae]|nr:N(4)-acetylcytidine aminohydrolase [Klebsiella pneumoniae]MDH1943798.1 N(4)-acetylcytidine aminohydrolase [Klebsiella pneumoniae]